MRLHPHRSAALAALCALAAATLASCSTSPSASNTAGSTAGGTAGAGIRVGSVAPGATGTAGFVARGSVDAAYVEGATPGDTIVLADAAGREVGGGKVDRLGSFVAWNEAPGPGYTFREVAGGKVLGTRPFSVLSGSSVPPAGFYSGQHMHLGLNYITMRDGVELAATVRLPPGKTLADGPFPTVIEDSGYAIAAPGSLIQAEFGAYKGNKALLPDSATVVGSVVAPLLGFATVSVQMRGTGCSGGAFDLFGPATTYDGYDTVEIVAAQPWVLHHKVGLVGISFSGISQLFVAGTDPPGLAAIAPLSVTDDLYSTGYPGGIYNSGFAASWIAQREHDAQPAPQGGEEYAKVLISQGDKQCLADQALRLESPQLSQLLSKSSPRVPALFDPRSPDLWAARIKVPVYLSGAFQDEQTGGQWTAMIPALEHDPDVYVTMTNGTHIDSLGPDSLSRWVEFLDIFVAGEVPHESPLFAALAGTFYKQVTGAPSAPLPALRFTTARDVAAARAAFEASTPRIRVLLDNGGGSAGPGALQPEWEEDFSSWPPPPALATAFYLGEGGALSGGDPGAGSVSFEPNPAARPATDLPNGGNVWSALPPYDWAPVTGRNGLGFMSPPLAHDLTVIGPASLDLWLKSSAPDTDLAVTISEVRPDGRELFIQTGQLRAGFRALDRQASGPLFADPTYLALQALPAGVYTEVRIPIPAFAYSFRAGSRIRVTIQAPGGDRPAWAFDSPATGGKVVDTVELGGTGGSRLMLSVIPNVVPPDAQPACPSLRGEPCRTYVPARNGG